MTALTQTTSTRSAHESQPTLSGSADASAEFPAVPYLPSDPWLFLAHVVRGEIAWRLAFMLLTVALAQIAQSLEPLALRHTVTSLTQRDGDAAVLWFAGLAGLWIASSLLFRLYEAVDIATSPTIRHRVQSQLFGYLLGHSPRYFQNNFAGRLGQKIKQAGQSSINVVGIVGFEVTRLIVLIVVGGSLLISQHLGYAGILAGWVALYLAVSARLAGRCVVLSKRMSEEVSTSTGRLIDAITNADLVRSFAKLTFERQFLERFLWDERRASRRLRTFLVLMRLFQLLATVAFLVTLIGLAIRETVDGSLDIGGFTMIFTLAGLIVMNVQHLSNRMLDYFEQLGTLTEALELVTKTHDIVDPPNARPLVASRGHVRFENVSFAFPDGTVVFDGLDLEIKPGEKIGLVGPSGAGKTTLIKLMRRQHLPTGGRVLIDGQDVTQATWDSVNEAIAEVQQFPGVFHRPVRDNIRYARPDATDAEVIAAARIAHCHEFISARQDGYDTIVGEQGIKLSGGERQRVAIARALVKDSRILVLDEATSSLDSESEHLIQEALWKLMEGRTVIAIAHRLSTVTHVDRIVYLENGRIVEQGNHKELVARNGAFTRMWRRQVGGFLGDGAST